MASGLAVVAADAAGTASLIAHDRTGLLCPPRDVNAFADATRRCVEAGTLRARLGRAAREEAAGYDWPEVLSRMVAYYRSVTE